MGRKQSSRKCEVAGSEENFIRASNDEHEHEQALTRNTLDSSYNMDVLSALFQSWVASRNGLTLELRR
eukprot:1175778-Prorocentrum_minimum.AAC.4